MNILITGATSAKAYQVKRKVEKDTVILGDYLELPPVMVKTGSMVQLPNPAKSTYAHEMLTLCLDKGIERIIVINEAEKEALWPARQLFGEYNIIIEQVDDKV